MQQKGDIPIASPESPVMSIYGEKAFSQLTKQEKNYTYYFTKASWEGQSLQTLKSNAQLSDQEFNSILAYVSAVLNNCGNYYSFGDNKFIPGADKESFQKLVQSCGNYFSNQWRPIIDELWGQVKDDLYEYVGRFAKIDFPDSGQSGYYSSNLTKLEIETIDEFLSIINISPLNTRIMKEENSLYKVLIASANLREFQSHNYKGLRIEVHYGDFSPFLRRVSENLSQALKYAANKNQEYMLKAYVQHFNSGDIEQHKTSQRWWIKDQGPVIETNIGFIETYLDPRQVRAEFEGMVSLVDKNLSLKTNNLVNHAKEYIDKLPWPKEYEKDQFIRPDFTSLEVLAFGSSGTPLGINIPNYDDIRQEEGFKNVHLGNSLPKLKNVLFLDEEDGLLLKELQSTNYIPYFSFPQTMFHKVIYHELLGHGSGKLFQQKSDGSNNYNPEIVNPITNQPVGNDCYKSNETWNSKFQALSNPYEECRADSVALYFSCLKEAYEILQPEEVENWEKIRSCAFIEFIYNGIMGLQFYNADFKKWGQAHINGRFVILQVLLEAGNAMITIEETKNEQGKDWLRIRVDKSKFATTGFKAISDFLVKMQVFKATGDFENAQKMFNRYSEVNEQFLRYRQIVIENKKPRRMEVQGNIVKCGGKCLIETIYQEDFQYKVYPETFEGIIQSYFDRFDLFDFEFYEQWRRYRDVMSMKKD